MISEESINIRVSKRLQQAINIISKWKELNETLRFGWEKSYKEAEEINNLSLTSSRFLQEEEEFEFWNKLTIEEAETLGNRNDAVKETIKSAKIALEKGREAAVSEFDPVQEMLASSNDAKEGVEAFKNKKPPSLKGN